MISSKSVSICNRDVIDKMRKNALAAPDSTGGVYSAPPDPLAGGKGAHCPSPRTPPVLSAFGLEFWFFGPQKTNLWLCL